MNMNICRTCLKTPADTHLSELEKCLNEDNKNYLDVMLFCLDIKVLSLKNDAYLKSLDSGVQLPDQKLTVYVDENGIKHENYLDSDDFGPSVLEDCNTEIKVEGNVKVEDKVDVKIESDNEDTHNVESDEEPLSVVQKVKKKYEDIREQTKVKAPKRKKFSHPKKTLKKSTEKHEAQICEECGKTFRNLKEHLLQHQPETKRRKVQCQACPKLFLNKGDRHRHYKTVHLGLKKKCSICNKEVTRLSVHMARHNPATLRFPCVECERRFVSQTELDAHVISHTNNYEYAHECHICQKKFSRKPFVARHIRQVHEKERKHQCKLCPKAFFTNSALQEHLGTHSKKRLYECNECGLALKTKETLRAHLTVHSGVNNYQCELCDKSFRTTG
ncbi:zinc finger protein OZF-like isoform X2 [Cydia pomonella]|uniref:zinc finger protein OZF-like isoform X2 n=1 Tax=Cydia pomonella TaxID=82600 RepID=UPI002ADD8098|nr:zinc finger protein OZF-like isoform X2 [Cydia pomonella]